MRADAVVRDAIRRDGPRSRARESGSSPRSGTSAPAIRLKVVLLPEPFGPIRPRISPSPSSNETSVDGGEAAEHLGEPVGPGQHACRSTVGLQARITGSSSCGSSASGSTGSAVLHACRPDDLGLAVDVLHHHRRGALVLARHRRARREELHAVALDRAAVRDVGVERGLAQRLGIDAAVLLDRARQHVGEEDPGLVEAHRDVRRHLDRPWSPPCSASTISCVSSPRPGCERLRIEQLRRRPDRRCRCSSASLPKVSRSLSILAVAGAVADQRRPLEPLLRAWRQEQRDVRVVAGVQDHVGARAPQLGHQAGEIGRGRRVAFLEHDLHAVLLAVSPRCRRRRRCRRGRPRG